MEVLRWLLGGGPGSFRAGKTGSEEKDEDTNEEWYDTKAWANKSEDNDIYDIQEENTTNKAKNKHQGPKITREKLAVRLKAYRQEMGKVMGDEVKMKESSKKQSHEEKQIQVNS